MALVQPTAVSGGLTAELVKQLQSKTGEIVSTTFTTWLHVEVLPQSSTPCQVWVTVHGQLPLVTVLRTVTETLPGMPAAFGQAFVQVGASKLQFVPHSTVLLVAQMRENPHPFAGGLTVKLKVPWLYCPLSG